MELSIVIPLHNEEENISLLLERLQQSLAGCLYEVILVDDGSTDQTVRSIQAHTDSWVHLVQLPCRRGQTFALKVGIDVAQGKYIVTMDGDLQNDPADIPRLLAMIKTGAYDMVTGYRVRRKDPWHRTLPSRLANRLIRYTTGVHLRDYGCTLKIFKASLAKELDLHGDLHRFIPVLAHMRGARMAEIPVQHFSRIYGQSKYGLNRILKVTSDLIMLLFFQKYWAKAMHLFGSVGIVVAGVGVGVLVYLLMVKLFGSDIGGRPLVLLGILAVLSGLQFISFGLIAEILYRVYHRSEVQKKRDEIYSLPSLRKFDVPAILPNDHSSSFGL